MNAPVTKPDANQAAELPHPALGARRHFERCEELVARIGWRKSKDVASDLKEAQRHAERAAVWLDIAAKHELERPRETYASLLRRWPCSRDLAASLAEHGIEVTEAGLALLVENEGLPDRYWRAFVGAARAAGHDDITLELLAEIAETDRDIRVAANARAAAATTEGGT